MQRIRDAMSQLSQDDRERLRRAILEQAARSESCERSVLEPDYFRRMLSGHDAPHHTKWGELWSIHKP
jgi:hypothetical protein